MKKSFIVLLIIMCVLLVGCQVDSNESNQKSNSVKKESPVSGNVNGTESKAVQWDENHNAIINADIPYYGYIDHYDVTYSGAGAVTVAEYKEYSKTMYESDDGAYLISDYKDGVCLNRYLGTEDTLIIPDKINGKKVIKIGGYIQKLDGDEDFLFMSAFSSQPVKSITLPKYVKEIADGVFRDPVFVDYFEPNGRNEFCLESVNVSEDNQWYSSENGFLYNKDKTILLEIPYKNN